MTDALESQIISHRRLLRAFVARDLRSRYIGSALGVFWSVIHPLLLLGLYILVFSTIVRGGGFQVHGRVTGYALYLSPAIIIWAWFSESLTTACSAITGNGGLIKKIVFPSAILPLAPVVAGLVPFSVGMCAVLVYAAVTAGLNPFALLWLPVLVALQFAMLTGPAFLLASLNVFIRDTSQVMVAVLQFLFWGTPIVYTPETLTVPFPWTAIWFEINPAAHLMAAYRDVIISGQAPNFGSLAYLSIFAILAYHVGRTVFLRSRRHFADEV